DESAQLATALATLHTAGVPVDWRAHEGAVRRRLGLATYPWQRERYWAAAPARRPPATPAWPAAVAAAEAQAEQAPLDLRTETYPERWEVLDRLTIAFIVRAWRRLGVFTTAGE